MTLGFHCMLPSFVTCNVCVKDREEKWPSYKVEYRFELFRLFNKYNLKILYFHSLKKINIISSFSIYECMSHIIKLFLY